MRLAGTDLLIVQGAGRGDGRTAALSAMLADRLRPAVIETVNLADMNLHPFDYRSAHQRDAFDQILTHILATRHLLFATPVYWYAMSGVMKTLFDRFTDILSHRDQARRGRQLEGRHVWLMASGTDPALPEGFEIPFKSTANYFHMAWEGTCYIQVPDEETKGVDAANLAPIEPFADRMRALLI